MYTKFTVTIKLQKIY